MTKFKSLAIVVIILLILTNFVSAFNFNFFGEVLKGGSDRYLFTGQEKDATGLMYYGARFYTPLLRQFTQPDTIVQNQYNPQNLNRYSYVLNNPYKYVDPTGNYIDTIADIGSMGLSIHDIIQNPRSAMNWLALGADIATTLLPFVACGGLMVKGMTKGGKIIGKTESAVDVFRRGGSTAEIGKSLKNTPARPPDKIDLLYADLPIEKVKIEDLRASHKVDDVLDILKNADHQDPIIAVERVGEKHVWDGMGRTTREIWKGNEFINARVVRGSQAKQYYNQFPQGFKNKPKINKEKIESMLSEAVGGAK